MKSECQSPFELGGAITYVSPSVLLDCLSFFNSATMVSVASNGMNKREKRQAGDRFHGQSLSAHPSVTITWPPITA